jgi:hypothetical protein
LIDHIVSHDLDGSTNIDFDRAGVRWTIAFPLGGLAGQRGTAPGSTTA